MIRFLQPVWLLAILPVLAVAAAYVWRQWRRRADAIRFTNVELLRTLAPKGLGWRRHLAAVALLLSMLVLATAMARPAVDTKVPLERATIVLAIDVSLSMQATDVAPSRLAAAQEAAKKFAAELPATYNLGLVSFAKAANVLVSPTKDRSTVDSAIDGLQLAEATATGEAVFTSLDAIRTVPADGAAGPPPARILLLSDGYRTYGRSIEEAAAAAAAVNVPVSTIAFGTDEGVVDIGGQTQRVPVDRMSLASLAESTHGYFYEAASATELRKVYSDIGSSIGHRTAPREVTHWYTGVGLLLALAAAGLSLLWTSRLP
ncbi:MAG TPA: VWA domain-containing protein [Micromonosporaceae bacterium]|jgi:Ca-activated chloride channel family protein|nr:VWA domain-containing protein [Micromonosporaceae bacterium]